MSNSKMKAATILGATALLAGLATTSAGAETANRSATVAPHEQCVMPSNTPNNSDAVYIGNVSGGVAMRTEPGADCGTQVDTLDYDALLYAWCSYKNSYGNTWIWGRVQGHSLPHWIYSGDLLYSSGTLNSCS